MRWLAGILLAGLATTASATTLGSAASTYAVGEPVDTYVIWGDTQSITQYQQVGGIGTPASGTTDLDVMAQWACDRKLSHNIKSVLAVGDLVELGQDDEEWDVVTDAATVLETCADGTIPYLPVIGNHDFNPFSSLQQPNGARNADKYHLNVGQDVMDAKGWFASHGTRPDYIEVHSSTGASLYLENTTTYGARSFMFSFNRRLRGLFAEWEHGIRLTRTSDSFGKTDGWVRQTLTGYPKSYFIYITHAGPCALKNCDLTPRTEDSGGSNGGTAWADFIEEGGPNLLVVAGGHWNRTANTGGAGQFTTAVRDDGSRWLAGSFDFSAVNGRAQVNPDTDTPWPWQGVMLLQRHAHQVCFRTVKMIDVDTDPDDGAADLDPAIQDEEYDRGSPPYSDIDPASAFCTSADSGPNNCPNSGLTCARLEPLPGLN